MTICLHNVSTKKCSRNIVPRNTKFCIQAYITIVCIICKFEEKKLITLGDSVSPHNVGCVQCPHNDNQTRMRVCMCVCVCVCVCMCVYVCV